MLVIFDDVTLVVALGRVDVVAVLDRVDAVIALDGADVTVALEGTDVPIVLESADVVAALECTDVIEVLTDADVVVTVDDADVVVVVGKPLSPAVVPGVVAEACERLVLEDTSRGLSFLSMVGFLWMISQSALKEGVRAETGTQTLEGQGWDDL